MLDQEVFLYIEDDPMSREIMTIMMTTMLQVKHFTVWEDSHNFISRVKALQPAPTVILLDIHMRPHTGFEMLEMLQADDAFHDTIVIALTASVMNEEVERLRSCGFDGAIGKPIGVASFPSLIKRIIQKENVWHIADD